MPFTVRCPRGRNVTSLLQATGEHVLSCEVGKGRYGEATMNAVAGRVCRAAQHSKGPACPPGIKVLLSMSPAGSAEAVDVVSDGTWDSLRGPVTGSDYFAGESYDASLELPAYARPGFVNATLLAKVAVNGSGFEAPFATIPVRSSWLLPPITVFSRHPTIGSWTPAGAPASTRLFDAGQNMAGLVELQVPASACRGGLELRMHFAEAIHGANGSLYHHIQGSSTEISTFSCDDSSVSASATGVVTYRSRWTQMGYRYIEINQTSGGTTATAADFDWGVVNVTGLFVTAGFDVGRGSSFNCSDPLTNRIQLATLAAARSNWLSFPTDCPQRERAGWLGDAHVGSETVLRNLHAVGGYRLFLEMIAEELNSEGNPPDVVPFLGGHGGGGTPTWTAAFPIIAGLVVNYTADARIAAQL